MTPTDVIREMREQWYIDSPIVQNWADALEAAMREPVGEVGYMWSSPSTSQATSVIRPLAVTHARHISPGTKLFALPPDAAKEIERLKNIIRVAHQEMQDMDDENAFVILAAALAEDKP